MHRILCLLGSVLGAGIVATAPAAAAELIPPAAKLKADHPRVLLRPADTPYAISLRQLRATARDADFNRMLEQLKGQQHAAAQAMVWLLTDDKAAAERAIARMRSYRYPGQVDTFHVFGHLSELGLAYDWLYNYPGFTREIKAEVRAAVNPLARTGLKLSDDHIFHNYIWMSAGGTALWALATAGEDPQADAVFQQIRQRFNQRLFPAMQYLDGLPSEPLGYWSLYDLTPCAWTLLAAQSASATDLLGTVRTQQGDWLRRHFEGLIHSTLPSMRYIPWGDLQGGPNGGVTMEMAGAIDGLTWALQSPRGAHFSRWVQTKRGLARFYGETAVFYFLYTRQLKTQPATPPLSYLAGGKHGGHFIARSGWNEGDTIVAFRCTDHYGDHNHYDQGSFIIWRNGLLAVDPPVYRKVGGPQQPTEVHNTLLLGGQGQRRARGQYFNTLEKFQQNLLSGRKLETGEMLFWHDAGAWAAVAGQFAQAYEPEAVSSCVRQLLFIRPDKVVVVDRLEAPSGKQLPSVQWLLQLPREPAIERDSLWAGNGKSWIRCRSILPAGVTATVAQTPVGTHCARFSYEGRQSLTLVHVLEVGDGEKPGAPAAVKAVAAEQALEVSVEGKRFALAAGPRFEVSAK